MVSFSLLFEAKKSVDVKCIGIFWMKSGVKLNKNVFLIYEKNRICKLSQIAFEIFLLQRKAIPFLRQMHGDLRWLFYFYSSFMVYKN